MQQHTQAVTDMHVHSMGIGSPTAPHVVNHIPRIQNALRLLCMCACMVHASLHGVAASRLPPAGQQVAVQDVSRSMLHDDQFDTRSGSGIPAWTKGQLSHKRYVCACHLTGASF